MFDKRKTLDKFEKLHGLTKANHAITLMEALVSGAHTLSKQKRGLLHDWINHDSKMEVEDTLASLDISDLISVLHGISLSSLEAPANNKHGDLFDTLGYLYRYAEGAISILNEEHNTPIEHEERLYYFAQALKPAVGELLCSAITLLHFYEQGHLSEDEANIIGYKLLEPSSFYPHIAV
jgi:hypothetical protein